MKYRFYNYNKIHEIDKKPIQIPCIDIEDAARYGWFFLDEISNLSANIEYMDEIVDLLEQVLSGKTEDYPGFGYEVYMISCDMHEAKVLNLFEGERVEAVMPTQEIYRLMKDWRDYVVENSPNG
jgi:hypothetical protein